jgi:hypothetical protein
MKRNCNWGYKIKHKFCKNYVIRIQETTITNIAMLCLRFLTLVTVNCSVFWDIMLWSLMNANKNR